jgi:adenylate cyclase
VTEDPAAKEVRRLERTVARFEMRLAQMESMRDTNVRVIDRLRHDLDLERERSRDLLLNILPERIVERLDAGEAGIADDHARVAILFSDFVGFTGIAGARSAAALLADLNRLFSAFDAACERFGVEKIKTIGDAYLAAAGLAPTSGDPVVAVGSLALAMRDAVADAGPPWQVRIGVHVGAVAAGIIGTHKFAYDVWGDTVNLASRLESSAEPGTIQVSEAAADALGSGFELRRRGTVDLKGKGPTPTWTLLGRR